MNTGFITFLVKALNKFKCFEMSEGKSDGFNIAYQPDQLEADLGSTCFSITGTNIKKTVNKY